MSATVLISDPEIIAIFISPMPVFNHAAEKPVTLEREWNVSISGFAVLPDSQRDTVPFVVVLPVISDTRCASCSCEYPQDKRANLIRAGWVDRSVGFEVRSARVRVISACHLTPELSRPAERAAARDHSSALAETAKRARLERIVSACGDERF